MKVVISFAAGLACFGVLSGCATLTKDDHQFIAIRSEPLGASCQVRQGGEVLGIVPDTPGTILVHKARHEIGVDCVLAGYHRGAGVIPTSFQDMTYGNLIVGGLVGLLVDTSSGAIDEYPHTVTVLLEPLSASREAPWQTQRRRFLQESRLRIQHVERMQAMGGW